MTAPHAVDPFHDEWLALRTRVTSKAASADQSSVWRRFIADFNPGNLDLDSGELLASDRYRGYDFVSTRDPRPARLIPGYCVLSASLTPRSDP